jgi:sugar lactone lactonase YvrE
VITRIDSLAPLLVALAACGGSGAAATDAPAAAAPVVSVVSRFDVARRQLPEGITIVDGVPYVGLALTSEIVRVDPASGAWAVHGRLPTVAPGTGFMTGITSRPGDPGALYAALASFTPDVAPGIYRVAAGGGAATPFAAHPDMAFPNGVAAGPDGALYVTDSAAAAIFRVDASGQVERWVSSELLAGDQDTSCAQAAGHGVAFAIGGNGIARRGDDWYVANSDRGTIVRVRGAGGAAGAVEIFAGPDCDGLGGIDGITAVGDDLVAAMNYQDEVARIDAAGRVHLLASGGDLDFPASPAAAGDALFVTAFAFGRAQTGAGAPALTRIDGWLAP